MTGEPPKVMGICERLPGDFLFVSVVVIDLDAFADTVELDCVVGFVVLLVDPAIEHVAGLGRVDSGKYEYLIRPANGKYKVCCSDKRVPLEINPTVHF